MKILFIIFSLLFLGCTDRDSKVNSTTIKMQPKDYSTDFEKSKDSLISLLPSMKSDSLDCNADIYWKIVKRGKTSIPLLIESLTDTTMTNVYDHCKKSRLNVGEVSYFALEELAEFPAFVVTEIQFDFFDENGCWSFFDYFFDNKNKKEYQQKVKDFYTKNNYVFEKFENQELNECHRKHKIEGKLKLK